MTLGVYTPRDLITYTVNNWERFGDKLQTWPEDKGNWFRGQLIGTKHGITPQVYFEYSGIVPDRAVMEAISVEDAITIFEKKFYDDPDLDEMPWVRPMGPVLDMAINAGPRAAVKILQRAINQVEHSIDFSVDGYALKVDGWLGPRTASALRFHYGHGEAELLEFIREQRESFYRKIVAVRPANQKFLAGWLNRAADFGPDGRWVRTLPNNFPFA